MYGIRILKKTEQKNPIRFFSFVCNSFPISTFYLYMPMSSGHYILFYFYLCIYVEYKKKPFQFSAYYRKRDEKFFMPKCNWSYTFHSKPRRAQLDRFYFAVFFFFFFYLQINILSISRWLTKIYDTFSYIITHNILCQQFTFLLSFSAYTFDVYFLLLCVFESQLKGTMK